MIFAGKKVLVFGTGKSGIAAEDLLHKKGASVVLYDGNDKLEKEEILKKLESRDSVEVVLGELPEEMLDSLDLVVLSPGVPTDLPVVLKMKEKEIPVIGEVELAYQVSRGKSACDYRYQRKDHHNIAARRDHESISAGSKSGRKHRNPVHIRSTRHDR